MRVELIGAHFICHGACKCLRTHVVEKHKARVDQGVATIPSPLEIVFSQ